jgi:pilus assembly protein CpaF
MLRSEDLTDSVRKRLFESEMSEAEAVQLELDQAFERGLFQLTDESNLHQTVEKSLAPTGDLDELVRDEKVEEIWINPDGRVFVSEQGLTRFSGQVLEQRKVRQLTETLTRDASRRLDQLTPFVDCSLANGSRVHIIGNGLTRAGYAINIRKYPNRILSLQQLVTGGFLQPEQAILLRKLVSGGGNLIISGGTNSGKTTLLCALLNDLDRNVRLISIEDTFEIRYSGVDWVPLQARSANAEGIGEITIRQLVREALRMRPDRLVVGEVRSAEAFDLLLALNSGISGMGTIHAQSAEGALQKLFSLPLLAGANISEAFIKQLVAGAVSVIIHCKINQFGHRKVTEICRLQVGDNREIELTDAFA